MAAGTQYVALLRGINVGGKNLVRMADLRDAFEAMEFDGVKTYINSGNVLFRSARAKNEELVSRIEAGLRSHLGVDLKVVLRTRAQLESVVESAPAGFGDPAYRCDVIFLRNSLTPKKAFSVLEMKEGVDEAWPGKGVLYFRRLDARATSSRLPNLVSRPEYKEMTIRSWSTTKKLAALIAES